MRFFPMFVFCFCSFSLMAQNASISGQLKATDDSPVAFATVALFQSADSVLVKVETSSETGTFRFSKLRAGSYFLRSTYLGLPELRKTDLIVAADQNVDLGLMSFEAASVQLAEAVVTANRRLVEVRPDRTVFNVEGTINATGSSVLELLRKAPGVQVDNNSNVNVLGRAGVLIYVDGKRLPLSGQDLSNYLENLQSAQIDRIDIITNPGAKYEAEGNAGIIDIRLKKDKNLGTNGSLNLTASQGRYFHSRAQASGNYRNKRMNVFANAGANMNTGFNDMLFYSYQNNLVLDEIVNQTWDNQGIDFRLGTDFFLSKKHTLGFLVSGQDQNRDGKGLNRITLAQESQPTQIDSILISEGVNTNDRLNTSYNINYRFDNAKSRTISLDLDFGNYKLESMRNQPNRYFDASETMLLTEVINQFDTPSDIDIYTGKIDFEEKLGGGQLGFGTKYSKVVSDNTFLIYDVLSSGNVLNTKNSNSFKYDEAVVAAYLSYTRNLNTKWGMSSGLRYEKTDATGNLKAFDPSLQEPPVVLDYSSWFPSVGLTYQAAPIHAFSLNYGRRINRPDYLVLNPFNNQLSQLSYEKGNPFLRPEIVNNVELGYTLAYQYNIKLAYSVTADQITRLIAPDDVDPRAGFITWDNLAEQRTASLNISAPVSIKKWWDIYINAQGSHITNQADYGNGATVDIQVFNATFYQQSTFSLPKGLKAEVSGWWSSPGVWGGVFLFDPSWSLDLGLQKKFLKEALTVRLSASDLFYQSYWSGISTFNGLKSIGSGRNDNRRVGINLNYVFGNQNVKSANRKTGIEAEAGRVGQ
jgi:iron complex outermembrane recepter protein